MKTLILVRHGESAWNKLNLFTGWTDVDLTEAGIKEAYEAGKLLKAEGYRPELCFTSYLKRAVKTLNNVLDAMDEDWIPVVKTWRLNEKHYGALQGLNKKETAKKYGDEQVLLWRRSYDVEPHDLAADGTGSALADPRYAKVPTQYLPKTESLKDCIARVMPFWECEIFPKLKEVDNIIVAAHGNSLRGIVKHLKGISDKDISGLNIPTATPYVFEFDDDLNLVKDYYLGDAAAIAAKAAAVANQGKA